MSSTNPWLTIGKVNTQVYSPGDRLYLAVDGSWNDAVLTLGYSGDSADAITVGSYGSGNDPIIEAGDAVTGWSSIPGNDPGTGETGGLFTSGFESGFTGWDRYADVGAGNTLTIATDAARYGSNGMKLTFGGSATAAYVTKNFGGPEGAGGQESELYVRFYVCLPEDAYPTASLNERIYFLQLYSGTHLGGASGTLLLRIGVSRGTDGNYVWTGLVHNGNTDTQFFVDVSHPFNVATWYCVEIHYKQGAAGTGRAASLSSLRTRPAGPRRNPRSPVRRQLSRRSRTAGRSAGLRAGRCSRSPILPCRC